ncbi:MAG: DNA polymerase/3'-5' exonuclease PolX [Gammaproteobacteria bacterium]|nr:DNA polymerase/3'-5' exonuclease PolX [Gammaproteobacteria bacterium]
MLEAAEISRILRELAQRIELQGGNRFRARAYRHAADNLVLTTVPIEQLIAEGRLQEISGVGEAIASVITQLHLTGQHAGLEALRKDFPAGVLEMLRVPGLRADRVRKLHETFGISSLDDLEQAARTGRLASLKGFGPAFQAKVLRDIELARAQAGRHIHRASLAMEQARAELMRAHPEWTMVTVAGPLRRACELIHTLSVVAVDPQHEGPPRSIRAGDEFTVHVTPRELYGITLLLATGSDAHLEALRGLAEKRGWTLDAAGLRNGTRLIAAETEEGIYAALDLPFIAPELREGRGEVQRALAGRLPALVCQDDIRGVLHAHTLRSDGADTLEDMADAAQKLGYGYLGMTDHSQSAHYARGLTVPEVLAQQREIEQVNQRCGSRFHVFRGIESDILADGALDYSEDVLSSFDLIIASVHSRFRMNREEQTARILKAIANPHTTILGHLTGRLLLKRAGYDLDMDAVLTACAAHGVAVEINANPWRLDLDWRWCERAVQLGCLLSINPDAHSTDEIDNMKWGVLMARKGMVPKDRVLNVLPREKFEEHLSERKRRAAP